MYSSGKLNLKQITGHENVSIKKKEYTYIVTLIVNHLM